MLAQSDPSSPETWDDYNYYNSQKQADAQHGADQGEGGGNPGQKRGESKAHEQNAENQEGDDNGKHPDPFVEHKLVRQKFDTSHGELV